MFDRLVVRAWTDFENQVVLEVELMLAPVTGPMKTTGVEPMDAPALELMNAPVVALVMVTPAVAKAD